ncbi:MAG: TRAP transporter small permease subunit, partial [Pseudomonadota bacterium]
TVRRRLAETFAVVVLFVFASVAAYYGFELWLKSTLAGHTTDTYLAPPKWFTHAPVWVGMVLLMLQGAVELTRIWSPAARGSANEHAAGSWKRSSSLSRWLLCCFCARRSPSRSAVSVSSCCG